MKTYQATVVFDCSQNIEVQANDPEEAIEAAYNQSGGSLCHQCSDEFTLGDAIHVVVYEGDKEAADDSHDRRTIAVLRAQVELVEQQRDKLLAALESARDTIEWMHGCTAPADDEIERAILEANAAITEGKASK